MMRFVDSEVVEKLFRRFSVRYGALWTTRLRNDEDWIFCHQEWLSELCGFTVEDFTKAVIKALAENKEYPPTLGQLIDLCLQASGIPSANDISQEIARKEFTHPLTKLIADRIGSWDLKNSSADAIKKRIDGLYTESLVDFRDNPDGLWKRFNDYQQQKQLPPPEPIKVTEVKSFKERMFSYQKMADEAKSKLPEQKHPEYAEEKINPTSRFFDKEVYESYKSYILSVPEEHVLGLPVKYAYDRTRFLTNIEAQGLTKDSTRYSDSTHSEKTKSRYSDGPTKIYKNWGSD